MLNHKLYFFAIAFLFALIGISSNSALAAGPANDNLANAQVLSGATGTINGTSVDATREQGEYSHAISNGTMVYRTVWFEWTATENKPAVFEITSSSFDAAMGVYTGNNYPLPAVSINNDAIGNRPRIEFAATAGTTYKIAVGLFNNNQSQGGDFTLEWTTSNVPTNDNFASAMTLPSTTSGSVAVANQNASKEQNEPTHIAGNRSVWLTYTNNSPHDYSLTLRTGRFAASIDTSIAVYTGSSLDNLTPIVKNDNLPSQSVSGVTFLAKVGVTYKIALDEGFNSNEWSASLNWEITKIKNYTDFGSDFGNGHIYYDQAADIAVFRPSDGTWWTRNSHIPSQIRAIKFGASGDTPVQGDYDGDGRTDLAVARDTQDGKIWYVRNSFDATYTILQWGVSGDKPLVGDYDFDGRVDFAVFRPSNGTWYIRKSSDGEFIIKQFGFSTDVPVSGDFKGTGAGTDIAVFRPSNGTWYVLNGDQTIFIPFGLAGDKPVVADYDNDGKSDAAVYRPSTGTWHILESQTNQVQSIQWGLPDDIPMTGDYDGNTNDLDDFAVYRPSENRWYILRSEGNVTEILQFGLEGDIPVSSANLLAQ